MIKAQCTVKKKKKNKSNMLHIKLREISDENWLRKIHGISEVKYEIIERLQLR